MTREVIHINISAFPVGVERVVDPRLRERPVAIAPLNSPRAVTLAVSREAYLEGVAKGMPVAQAKKLCPALIVIPPNLPLYRRAESAVLEHLARYSPLLEPWRPGHAYLDLTGTRRLFGPPVDTAAKIQREIKERFSLRNTVGLAGNKLVSRVASRVIRPRGVCDIFPGSEPCFLAPLDVAELPGVGVKTLAKLRDLNISRVGELAGLQLDQVMMAFGPLGYRLHRFARGIDESPVRPRDQAESVLEEETLAEDTNNDRVLLAALHLLVERAGRRLRMMNRGAGRVRVEIIYADHLSVAREKKLSPPTNLDRLLFHAAQELLERALSRRVRVRHLALILKELAQAPRQLGLFEEETDEREARLLSALDLIREKFGEKAVLRGMRA